MWLPLSGRERMDEGTPQRPYDRWVVQAEISYYRNANDVPSPGGAYTLDDTDTETGVSSFIPKPDALFRLAGVGVVQTDLSSGRLMRANPTFCELVGYREDELKGVTHTSPFTTVVRPL